MLILRVSEATTPLTSLTDVALLADGCRVDMAYKTSISETAWKYFTSKAEFPDRDLLVFLRVTLLSGVQE